MRKHVCFAENDLNMEINQHRGYPLGDDYYKAEAWIREGYIDKGEVWTAYPPGAFPLTD